MLFKPTFDLIDAVCKWDANVIRNLSSEDFQEFRKQYTAASELREEQLRRYVREKDYYRTFMPVSSHTFGAINEVIWYYNEILLSDPVLFVIHDNRYQEQGQIYLAGEAINALLRLKKEIEAGYVLLTNAGTGVDHEAFKEQAALLFELPSVADGFAREVQVFKQKAHLPNGEDIGMLQLMAYYDGWSMNMQPTGMYWPENVPKEKFKDGIQYNFTGTFERMSRHELRQLGKETIITNLQPTFLIDAKQTIGALVSSEELNTPGLFLRHIDFQVAQTHILVQGEAASQPPIDKMQVYRSILPFVSGIPSERLMEVREEIPEAFLCFRGLIFRLHQEAQTKGYSPEETKEWIRTKVSGQRMNLEREMKSLLRKSKYSRSEADQIFLSGSLSQSLPRVPSPATALNPLIGHPMFYLWKAGLSKGRNTE